jgi:hypothetical protein
MSEVLSKAISRAVDEYPDFDDAVGDGFRRLLELEESDSRDAISIGREFGRYLAVPLRTIAGDRSSSDLDDVFANLTAAVYVMDAIDDLDDDFMDGTFNPYLPRDGVFVNSRDFISSHLYDLTSDVNSVIGSVQGPYSRARAGMKAHASLCDNIVYYGILYGLFLAGFFEATMDFVILLFGFGMVVSLFLDVGFYLYSKRFIPENYNSGKNTGEE